MTEYLAEKYARENPAPRCHMASIAFLGGVAGGLALFVLVFHDAPARAAMARIEAEQLIEAGAW